MSVAYSRMVDLGPWPFVATAIVGAVVIAVVVWLAIRGVRRG